MKTASEILNDETQPFDCMPFFEGLINQFYLFDVFVFANAEHTVFSATIYKQFEGVMNESTPHETVWTDNRTGWLEDGVARKGDKVSEAAFFTAEEAINWVRDETVRLLKEDWEDLDKIAP